jgi:enoyl-CoA hydratase/carnithine racemase
MKTHKTPTNDNHYEKGYLLYIIGHAFGGGAFLALACDFRIMRPDKGWLNWPETAINLRFGEPLLKLAR